MNPAILHYYVNLYGYVYMNVYCDQTTLHTPPLTLTFICVVLYQMKLGLFTILVVGALSITCTQADIEIPILDRNLQDNINAAESGTRYWKPCTIPCMYNILKARKCQYKYCCGTQFRHSYASEVGEDIDSSENSMMDMSMDMDMMDMGMESMGMDMGMDMEDMGMSEMAHEEEGTSIGGQWRKKYCPYRCMYYVYEAWKCQKYHKCCRTRPYNGFTNTSGSGTMGGGDPSSDEDGMHSSSD